MVPIQPVDCHGYLQERVGICVAWPGCMFKAIEEGFKQGLKALSENGCGKKQLGLDQKNRP